MEHLRGSLEGEVAALRAAGGRLTSARRALIEALCATDEHLSAEQLAVLVSERAPEVHLSTVYRALEDLQGYGIVAHAHLSHGASTYQLVAVSHAHFVCESCGLSFRADDELFDGLLASAKKGHGFIVDVHHLAVPGRCSSCVN
ncbi:MAG: transcriptional repressor [Actinomycetota bacterium]|jgi:Fe2+ or Zn2+ uptake regulation protein